MEDYERQTQVKFGKLLERQNELDIIINQLESELSQNEMFKRLAAYKEEREHLFDKFKEEKVKEFKDRKIKSVDGTYGKITMRENVHYKVVDESKVPKEFFKPAVDVMAIKKQYLLNKTVDGIERTVSHSLILTPKRTEESS